MSLNHYDSNSFFGENRCHQIFKCVFYAANPILSMQTTLENCVRVFCSNISLPHQFPSTIAPSRSNYVNFLQCRQSYILTLNYSGDIAILPPKKVRPFLSFVSLLPYLLSPFPLLLCKWVSTEKPLPLQGCVCQRGEI